MQRISTIVIIMAAVAGVAYFLFRQWRYEQQLSSEAKRQWWRQQMPPIFFLATLSIIGLATLAKVNAILLLIGGTIAAGIIFGFPALQFYHHSQRETVPRSQLILVYGIFFLLFAFVVVLIFAWLRMFGVL